MPEFAFVTSNPDGSVKDTEKRRVRSHCMKGKNKRENSRRSIREARQAVVRAAQSPGSSSSSSGNSGDESDVMDFRRLVFMHKVPPPSPLDITLIPFAGEVDKGSVYLLHSFLILTNLKTSFYPIQSVVDFGTLMTDHSPWLLSDDCFLHSVVTTTSAMQDFLLRRALGKTARYHMQKTLYLLNERLSDPKTAMIDSTIWIILNLVLVAGFFQDNSAVGTHITGLRQLVDLYGGRTYLLQNPKLHFKLENLDLTTNLAVKRNPQFLLAPKDWNPYFNTMSPTIYNQIHVVLPPEKFDPRMIGVFNDLQHLTALINHHLSSNSRLDGHTYQPAISSIQTRLLHLKDDLSCPRSESLCLATLAFLLTTFAVPGRTLPYTYLTDRLRKSCNPGVTDTLSLEIRLWVVLVCVMTVVRVQEPWARRVWHSICSSGEGMSWRDAKDLLKRVTWIDSMHDEAGERNFDALNVLEKETGRMKAKGSNKVAYRSKVGI